MWAHNQGVIDGWRYALVDGTLAIDNSPIVDAVARPDVPPALHQCCIPLSTLHRVMAAIEIPNQEGTSA